MSLHFGWMPSLDTDPGGPRETVLLNALVVLNSNIATDAEREEAEVFLDEHVAALRGMSR